MKQIESNEFIELVQEDIYPVPTYKVKQPNLTPEEKSILENVSQLQRKSLNVLKNEPSITVRRILLEKQINEALPESKNKKYLSRVLAGVILGYGPLSIYISDDDLEEIMVNGVNVPVYVFHRIHGMCRTDLKFGSAEEITKLVDSICLVNGAKLEDIVDIATVEGNRVNITTGAIPAMGPTVTIRKKREKSFSIIELVGDKTISLDLAAYLWLAVEGLRLSPSNMLVAGSIGSGKTTTLNALCVFIPPTERIVTIEDTIEINLDYMEDKVQLQTDKDHSMEALLRDTLRMRPDRIIVGEVRGQEAITLFNAMNIGRVGMGTIHASSAKEVLTRLQNQPMNVPPNTISSLDLILIQNRFVHKTQVVRRVTAVTEVTGAVRETIFTQEIFEWDPNTDTIVRKKEGELKIPIYLLDKISQSSKLDKTKLIEELKIRRSILAYMVKNNISTQQQVAEFMRRFYMDRKNLEKMVFGKENDEERGASGY